MAAKFKTVDCGWCGGEETGEDGCDACGGTGKVNVPDDLEERIEKQEEIVSILWSFAKDQQTKPHNCTNGEGVSVSLDAVGVAKDRMMKLFGLEPVEIQ